MKRTTGRTLSLQRTTVRNLTRRALVRVAGGRDTGIDDIADAPDPQHQPRQGGTKDGGDGGYVLFYTFFCV